MEVTLTPGSDNAAAPGSPIGGKRTRRAHRAAGDGFLEDFGQGTRPDVTPSARLSSTRLRHEPDGCRRRTVRRLPTRLPQDSCPARSRTAFLRTSLKRSAAADPHQIALHPRRTAPSPHSLSG
ncbi:hypothetical protein GCM10017562_03550 [Streptomyces roseofulvus]